MKKFLLCIFICILCLSLGACSGSEHDQGELAAENYVRYRYIQEEFPLPREIKNDSNKIVMIDDMEYSNGIFYIEFRELEIDSGKPTAYSLFIDNKGNVLGEYDITDHRDSEMFIMDIEKCLLDTGEFASLQVRMQAPKIDDEKQINWDSEEDFLTKTNDKGEVIWEHKLDSRLADAFQLVSGGDKFCVCASKYLGVYNNSGELLFMYESPGDLSFACFMPDSCVAVLERVPADKIIGEKSGRQITKIDVLNQSAVKFMDISGSVVDILNGDTFEFYINSGSTLYGVDNKKEMHEILNFTASGIRFDNDSNLLNIGDGKFVYYNKDAACILTPSDLPYEDMVVLKLGTLDPISVTDIAANFNKSSSRYQIEVVDYSKLNTAENSSGGMEQLEKDILSGEGPDIYDLLMLPRKQYEKQGRLTDLYPFIKRDKELKEINILPELLPYMETDGKLFSLIPTYRILTLEADPAMIGTDKPDMKAILALYDKMEEGENPFGIAMSKREFIEYMLSLDKSIFINWDEGICNFNNEQFISLLEFAKMLPDDSEESEQMNMVYQGKQLLMNWEVSGYVDMILFNNWFHDNMQLCGIPSAVDSGMAMKPYMALGISSDCEDKEGAWEFLRTLLFDNMQAELTERGLPITESGFEYIVSNYNSWVNSGGRVHTLDAFGNEITITVSDNTFTEMLREAISSVNCVSDNNEGLIELVWREAQPYFAEDKSAEQVAENIQSRASIYLAEQS